MSANEDKWIAIQHKTFVNWANEQLSLGNRSVENLAEDLCDGVRLVAIVEALQFKKIGKVYSHPNGRIQMLHNVSLALQAIASDNVKLVNIGNDDIVGGNLKLILGLLWHLIIRYQISSNKSVVPPKKLMISWFHNAIPQMTITNFTSDWRNGIALQQTIPCLNATLDEIERICVCPFIQNKKIVLSPGLSGALIEYLKPGLSPKWASLSPNDSVQNCRTAMQLAKEHLNVPRVISPEDFASPNLDELSAMTYLSYFIRKNSPGYFNTLNWACKQLKTTNISNLNTDWNDGYYLCALVHSLGGDVPGWPNLNRNDHLANCQLGIDCAKKLGIEPVLTATEMSDPNVDHLTVMAYISKFQTVTPRKSKAEKVELDCKLDNVTVGKICHFLVRAADVDTEEKKVKVWLSGPGSSPHVQIAWSNRVATCSFQPTEAGLHKIFAQYDGTEILGCPVTFTVQHDLRKVRITGLPDPCQVGKMFNIEVFCSADLSSSIEVKVTSPTGTLNSLNTSAATEGLMASFKPSLPGSWSYQVLVGNQELNSSSFQAFDPLKAWLTGADNGIVGEEVALNVSIRDCGSTDLEAEVESSGGRKIEDVKLVGQSDIRQIIFLPKLSGVYRVKATIRGEPVKGSPKAVEVVDPGQIVIGGEGLVKGARGVEAFFNVNKQGLTGEITTTIEVSGQVVPVVKETVSPGEFLFHYIPYLVGTYQIDIKWDGKHVAGSPFSAQITDKSRVLLLTNLNELRDDNDHIALEYDQPMNFNFDVSKAGPGKLTAEVLSPAGKLPVHVTQVSDQVKVTFTAKNEGDHYIHLYWSDVPLEISPLLAYCSGPPGPLDASKVFIVGRGAEMARATVPAKFIIDGKKAGPGVPRVKLQGVQTELPVQISPLKYNRYQCSYLSSYPGSFLLFVYWSEVLVPPSPIKIAITSRGDVRKVKVSGNGLNGGIAGTELIVFINTVEAGPGEVTAECHSHRQSALCDLMETSSGLYTLKVYPAETEKYVLQIRYDGVQVAGSPFILRVGDPPDPSKVKVFGPGIEDGHIDTFESRFLVDTHGAGAGQLAIKIRGPRGGFKVEMRRETENERIINCRYDPSEPGRYEINVRWSGYHVPGSPFNVRIVETREELNQLIVERGYRLREEQLGWKAEI